MYHACVYTAVVPNVLFLYKITRAVKPRILSQFIAVAELKIEDPTEESLFSAAEV